MVRSAWEETRAIAQELQAGLVLFQCPASFGPTPENRRTLGHFFETLDRHNLRLVWEPRGDWTPSEVQQLCQELDLILGLGPFTTPPGEGAWAYFRLHGRTGYRYKYTDQDLEKLLHWLEERQRVYGFFNNQSMWTDARRFQALVR
ncbi:MAG: DUF72 domain-containing protein [Desulfobacteraceae bacterium]